MKQRQPFFKTFDSFLLKNWLRLFALSLIFYSHFLFYFIWGNHDWGWVKETTPILSGLFEGRFSQFILQTILTEGKILPIFTIFFALLFFSLSAILFIEIFKLQRKSFLYLIIGLFITTSPYIISWLYFHFITLSCLSWPLFIIFGYLLLIKVPNSSHPKTLTSISGILFLLSLGGYPPSLNLICCMLFFIIINDLCFNKLTPKFVIKKSIPIIIAIIFSVLGLVIIQHYLTKYNLQHPTYNTAQLNINTIPQKLYSTILISLKQFIITTSFISYFFKYLTLCTTILSIITLYINSPKTIIHYTLLTLSIIGVLISSVLTVFIAQNTYYVISQPRIEFFGIFYIYIFSILVLQKSNNAFLKNLSYVAIILLILYNTNTLSYAAKIWNIGFKSETLLADRIITSIEKHKNFDLNKKYTFVQGGTLDFRSRFYLPKKSEKLDSYTLTAPYIPWHLPSKAYKFYYPKDFFGNDFDIFWSYVNPLQIKITNDLYQYLDNQSKPWPKNNSIFIDNNTIILTLTQDGKQKGKQWIRNIY